MIYRSNLTCPDLRPYFKLLDPPLQTLGHDMPSDPEHDPNCGYWTDDEAAILFNAAKQIPGTYCDIGSRFGWTAAHLIAAGAEDVWGVDPEYRRSDFTNRALDNCPQMIPCPFTAAQFFPRMSKRGAKFAGFVIDGDHDEPQPLLDALGCLTLANPDCLMLFHDFRGKPIQDAVTELIAWHSMRCRIYDTPNGVALLWRGYPQFHPPDHTPDPAVDWAAIRKGAVGFDWSRTE